MKSLNGRVMDFLSDYTGSLNDRLFKFLRGQGLTGALPDMMRKMGIKKLADILGLTLGETRSILNFNGTQIAKSTEGKVIPDPSSHFDVSFYCNTRLDGTLVSQNFSATVGERDFQVFFQGGRLTVVIAGASNNFDDLASSGNWRIKFDGTNLLIERDGVVLSNTVPTVGSASESDSRFCVGARLADSATAYGYHYDGVIADVVVRDENEDVIAFYPLSDNDVVYQPDALNTDTDIYTSGEVTLPHYYIPEDLTLDFNLDENLVIGEYYLLRYSISDGRVDLREGTSSTVKVVNLAGDPGTFEGTVLFQASGNFSEVVARAYSTAPVINAMSIEKVTNGLELVNFMEDDIEVITQDAAYGAWFGSTYDLSDVAEWQIAEGELLEAIPGGIRGTLVQDPANNPDESLTMSTVNTTNYIKQGYAYRLQGTIRNFTDQNQIAFSHRYETVYTNVPSGGSVEADLVVTKDQPYNREFQFYQRYLGDPGVYIELVNPRSNATYYYTQFVLPEGVEQVDLQQQESFENFFNSIAGGTTPDVATVDATTLTLSETTGTLGDPMVNTYATKLSGITEPVYFEIRVDATQGQAAWDDIEPYIGLGCDFEKFIHFAMGDSSAQNYGGFVLSSITKATQVYADGGETFLFSDIRYPEDENLASAGWIRVGVRYDPTTREIWLHVFYENTVDISFRTATGPFQSGSNSVATVAEPYTTTTVTNAADSADDELCITLSANRYYYGAGDTTLEILTQESDFLLPGGIPSGYTALHDVTGTETAEYDLGDYVAP